MFRSHHRLHILYARSQQTTGSELMRPSGNPLAQNMVYILSDDCDRGRQEQKNRDYGGSK